MKDIQIYPSELVLENFRSFRDVNITLGSRITIVSGANGVGKSNIISLIASGSGINKRSGLGSNFQPEFSDFFNIDPSEKYQDYKIFLKYEEKGGNYALTKRLSFKDDSATNRGIRIIPRTTPEFSEKHTIKEASDDAKANYGVGGSGRVLIPTIYLSLSRLYPLGEQNDSTKISKIKKSNPFAQDEVRAKYREWYNYVIPGTIKEDAGISIIEKKACSRASLHMDMENIPSLSQSIGQDNIGNVISALADIYQLSKESTYKGALLCIDEIEVSLHPDTQTRMLDLLEKVSKELKLQIIVSTHSLTVLKEGLKREKHMPGEYKVIYLKNPSSPYVTEIKNYTLLKRDLFGGLSYDKILVKMYFEDVVGQEVFKELMDSFKYICSEVKKHPSDKVLRNSDSVKDYAAINRKIMDLEDFQNIRDDINQIVTHCGCDELLDLAKADRYFDRVIIMLDGDARLADKKNQPRVCDYLDTFFNPKEKGLNDREHKPNIIFAPGYFAPESYYYKFIREIIVNENRHLDFWRGMDRHEETALYTADKIKGLFTKLGKQFSNDDLKSVFGEEMQGEIWDFIKNTTFLNYLYFDYSRVGVLLDFVEKLKAAYEMVLPLTLANRYS